MSRIYNIDKFLYLGNTKSKLKSKHVKKKFIAIAED